jgi:hypothetical protein
MTKQELYRALCIEAGTYHGDYTADEWWSECSHNIAGLEDELAAAADGDVAALVECRRSCGLPALV